MSKVTVVINTRDDSRITLKELDSDDLRKNVNYFQGFLNFEESKNISTKTIEISFDYGDHLKTIILYLSGRLSDPNITFLNCVELMYTSTYFQATSYFNLCVQFLLDNFHFLPLISKKKIVNEILELHDILLPINELYPEIRKFFLTKGLTEETGSLPIGLVTSILQSDELQVQNELDVASFISSYLTKNSHLDLTDDLLYSIRFRTPTFESKKFFKSEKTEYLRSKMTKAQKDLFSGNSVFRNQFSGNRDLILTEKQKEDVSFLRPGSLGYLLLVSEDRIDIFSKADNNGLGEWFQHKNLNDFKITRASVDYNPETNIISWRGGIDEHNLEYKPNEGVVELNLKTGEVNKTESGPIFTNSAHVQIGNDHYSFGAKSPFLPELVHPAACKISDTKILVCGGLNRKTCLSTDASYIFCTETEKITKIKPMKTTRHKHKLVLLGDFVYAIGGSFSDADVKEEALSSCEKYSLKKKKWYPIREMNCMRKHPGVTTVLNTICVVGGLDHATGHNNINMEVYDTSMDEWFMVDGKGSELKGGARRFPSLFWIPPTKLDMDILEAAKEYSKEVDEQLELTTQEIWDLHF